ncbi:TPA: GIY-YIG nuclease family protein [Clostridioides difficile]|nr:GIY-YIG nuclease family protein [Clostridioides difficile]
MAVTLQNGSEVYGVVYLITNTVNNKKYVGVTTQKGGFDARYNGDLFKYTHNEHLKNSIKKYGIDAFRITKELAVAHSQEELDALEISIIDKLNTTDPRYGYNKTEGGSTGVPTEETREKLSKSKRGKKKNDAQCHKVVMLDYETNKPLKVFISMSDACRWLGKNPLTSNNNIALVCRGINKRAYGYRWRYLEEYKKDYILDLELLEGIV